MEKLKRNREGWLESNTQRQCTNCKSLFEKTSKTVTLCKKCNSLRVKEQSAEIKMYRRAKARAKQQDIPFDLEVTDIVIPKICPILGIDIYVTTGKSGGFNNSPSLDKIDPTKGYVKGNIQVISQLANAMKSNANVEELIRFAKYIINEYTDSTI